MEKMIVLEEAANLIAKNAARLSEPEKVDLLRSIGRIAAVDYKAEKDQPSFDRSPLDGYALRSADIVTASEKQPVELTVIETVYAGDVPTQTLGHGQAVRIMTGAMLPEGADCVIRQEDTDMNRDAQQVTCRIYASVKAQENICRQGEDIREGTVIIRQGTVVSPAYGAVLAAQGISEIMVYSRISVAILTTGSELITDKDVPGKIFNSNGPMLAMRLAELGIDANVVDVPDDPQKIRNKIEELIDSRDAILMTGGVSVGEKDYIPEVMKQLNAQVLFHGLDMKPGSPMLCAKYHNKMLYCLSGNPFAAMATFELLAVSGLLKTAGLQNAGLHRFKSVLLNDFSKKSLNKRRFIRAQRTENGIRIPDNHSSGSLYSMIGCNCLVDIPEGSGPMMTGMIVQAVELFDIRHVQEQNDILTDNSEQNAHTPVLCICGHKNAGKTTFLEGLLTFLLKEKLRIGVIKHDGHDFIPDVPGTDSARLQAAGACTTAVYSDKRQGYYLEQSAVTFETVKKRLVEMQIQPLDLILVEGLKNSNYNKIEIMRQAVSKESAVHGGRLLAVCADFPVTSDRRTTQGEMQNEELPKQFGLTDYEQTARFILQYIRETR